MVEILPSILSADFTRLGAEVEQVQRAGARMLHLDIMDGRFVPNISFGPGVVKAVRGITNCYLDVHLMIEDPDRYIKDFIEAGAQSISVHQETCPHLHRTLRFIQSEGAKAGVVLNPSTPVSLLEDVYDVLDYVLLMSVNPGFGGQQFIPRTLAKVIALDRRRAELGLNFPIEIDGGVTLANLAEIVRAGCDWVVAGSAIFDSEDPAATFSQMQQIAREATAVRV
jgi:ribulose-phosphate 3-epimerase